MTVAHWTLPPHVLRAANFNGQNVWPAAAPEVGLNFSYLSSKFDPNILTVNYKSTKDIESQMLRHTRNKNDEASCLEQDRQNKVHFFKIFSAFHAKLINFPAEFQ